jgi:hypothetical protein
MGAGALVAAALMVACGGGDEDESLVDQVTSEGDGSGVETSGSTWLDLLQFVPDTPETRGLVVMGDVAGAAEARDVEMPTEDEAAWPVAGYYSELSGMSSDDQAMLPSTEWMTELQEDEAIRDELGYSYGQVHAYAATGEPPDTLDVLLGGFDAEAIDETLATVPFWSDEQEEVGHGGETYYRWLGDLEMDVTHNSPARPLGHGGRMWVSDDAIVRTRSDAMTEAAIDAAGGEGSLVDNTTFRSLAEALDQPGLYSAFLTDEVMDGTDAELVIGMGADEEAIEEYEEAVAAGEHTLLTDVAAYGSAWGLVDGEVVTVLAIASADEAAATANEASFTERFATESSPMNGQPYAELLQLERSEVDGLITIFWFEGDRATFFFEALMRRDAVVATDG